MGTEAERSKRFTEKQVKSGLVRRWVWVPKEETARLREFAESLRDGSDKAKRRKDELRAVAVTANMEFIINAMLEHGVPPDESFVAAAGKDFGFVEAWSLPYEGYAIRYGDNARLEYGISGDAADLYLWLENPYTEGLDAILQTANVRGEGFVRKAVEGDAGPFYVLGTRRWYGPAEISSIESDAVGMPLEFATYAEAEKWVMKAEREIYYLSHNESGRPSYKIICAVIARAP